MVPPSTSPSSIQGSFFGFRMRMDLMADLIPAVGLSLLIAYASELFEAGRDLWQGSPLFRGFFERSHFLFLFAWMTSLLFQPLLFFALDPFVTNDGNGFGLGSALLLFSIANVMFIVVTAGGLGTVRFLSRFCPNFFTNDWRQVGDFLGLLFGWTLFIFALECLGRINPNVILKCLPALPDVFKVLESFEIAEPLLPGRLGNFSKAFQIAGSSIIAEVGIELVALLGEGLKWLVSFDLDNLGNFAYIFMFFPLLFYLLLAFFWLMHLFPVFLGLLFLDLMCLLFLPWLGSGILVKLVLTGFEAFYSFVLFCSSLALILAVLSGVDIQPGFWGAGRGLRRLLLYLRLPHSEALAWVVRASLIYVLQLAWPSSLTLLDPDVGWHWQRNSERFLEGSEADRMWNAVLISVILAVVHFWNI